MKPEDRKAFLEMTFDPINGYGFSYVRISIGCSDFSLSEYTCCDKEGIENFALTDEETKYVIPILKEILAVNPSLKIMGTPWTPPKWMKVKDLESLEKFDSWTSGQAQSQILSGLRHVFRKMGAGFRPERNQDFLRHSPERTAQPWQLRILLHEPGRRNATS